MTPRDGDAPARGPGPGDDWPLPRGFDRRSFLVGVSATAAGWALVGGPRGGRSVEAAPEPARARTFTPEEWRTLAAAVDRLLPSDTGSPGARDVNAIGWLDAVLSDAETDPLETPLVRDGAARLEQRARSSGATSFAALPEAEQEAAIRAFEATDGGKAWLKVVLGYVMEAFLGDPIHGVNPGEAGWAWSGAVTGTPRPTGSERLPFLGPPPTEGAR